VTGLAAAAKRGILIKGGVHLEQGKLLRVVALDKTGTITLGRPSLTDVVPLGATDRDTVLRLAASLDAGSDHPVARAVTAAWTGPLVPVESFASITGRGVRGLIDGQEHFLGNARLAQERGVRTAEVDAALAGLESQGKTAIALGNSRGVLGVLAVADTPRTTSTEAIASLHQLGVRVVMLSGDNQRTAEAIAAVVGIDEARGGLLPEDKLVAIGELLARSSNAAVGMVGDGVNDAPALAKASIGFAMGAAGTDTAIETADVALMHDDLRGLPEFLRLSRRVSRILKQNIAIALVTKAAFFLLALVGLASLWMAVLADVGATIVVIANGLRAARVPQSRNLKPVSSSRVTRP
jgi:Cd2+/Zn2+-exporting ATPase